MEMMTISMPPVMKTDNVNGRKTVCMFYIKKYGQL